MWQSNQAVAIFATACFLVNSLPARFQSRGSDFTGRRVAAAPAGSRDSSFATAAVPLAVPSRLAAMWRGHDDWLRG